MNRLGLVFTVTLVVLGAAAPTLAEPPRGRDRERQQVLEQLKQRGLALPSSSAFLALPSAAPSGSVAPVHDRLAELARRWKAAGENRLERRERSRAALVRQLGSRLSDPHVKDELKLHATRVAELARMRFLAENARSGAEREKLLARIEKLSAREASRHQKQLAKLSAAAPAPSGSVHVKPAASLPAPAASSELKP